MDYLFELPIYSMTEKEFNIKIDKRIKNKEKEFGLYKNNENYDLASQSIKDSYYRHWKFNQIVGYLCFNIKNNSIDGYLWWINQKRIPLIFDKKIYNLRMCYPSWNIYLNKNMTNKEICETVLQKIGKDSTGFLKKYFIDTTVIEHFGKYINWHDFIE